MKRQQEQTRHPKKNRSYIEGNTVRRLDAVPNERRRERREEPGKKKRVSHSTRRNREKAMQMSLGYVLFLTVVSLVTVLICMTYIKLQWEVNQRMRRISTYESTLLNLKTSNEATYKRLETSIDYEAIKNKAIHQLGMRHPSEEQIELYDVSNEDYMEQYDDIPKKNE